MKKLTATQFFPLILIALLFVSTILVMAQDDDDNALDDDFVADCESDDISDEDYDMYCADDFFDEEMLDCESDDISDEDYDMYCADDFFDEEMLDCESDDVSDEEYDMYCADDFYDEQFIDCEYDDLSDEDYAYYCEFDYEDYYDDYGDFVEDDEFADTFANQDESVDQEQVSGTFVVSEDANLDGNPQGAEEQLWNAFVSIIPPEWVARISSFEVINDPETAGYVYVDENDPSKFVLALEISGLDDPQELIHTIIHEFAHILTLNSGQVDGTAGTCPTLQLDEGCSNARSYINQFNDQFWGDGTAGANDFVSEYASTDIAEDMAESFAAFVLQDKPTGSSIAENKINFFYGFQELVALRQQIRANIAAA